MEKHIGQVKFFNKDRGFGFIKRLSDEQEFFVHHSSVKPKTRCWNVLYKGEYVEFEIGKRGEREQAEEVTGIQGGTLLCEHEFEFRRRMARKRVQKKNVEDNKQ